MEGRRERVDSQGGGGRVVRLMGRRDVEFQLEEGKKQMSGGVRPKCGDQWEC